MTPDIIESFLVVFTLIWSVGGGAWLIVKRRHDLAHLSDQFQTVIRDKEAQHIAILQSLVTVDDRLRAHSHPLEPHDHAIYSPLDHHHDAGYAGSHHDHPHTHEHVQHTHTLVNRSEHEENGKKVVVKQCVDCDTVFRDKQE